MACPERAKDPSGDLQPLGDPRGATDHADLLGDALGAVVPGVEGPERPSWRLGSGGRMLDPLGDEPHAVPDHGDARRDRNLAALRRSGCVAARQKRLHRVPRQRVVIRRSSGLARNSRPISGSANSPMSLASLNSSLEAPGPAAARTSVPRGAVHGPAGRAARREGRSCRSKSGQHSHSRMLGQRLAVVVADDAGGVPRWVNAFFLGHAAVAVGASSRSS